eukprot:CAMPEP_0184738510 /NCGR_PEP_ID=MMETSP0315-20130426/1139_1 /TAXON_ID=101924 /ORGANISM="Rhodosorus marinus, Strain UTEX LB 2760" /LENGTH=62 /DNA_ID=CAMNT_0027206241 /DNA_START=322 /DNA_END=510 /DNA_ORIENTATION=+
MYPYPPMSTKFGTNGTRLIFGVFLTAEDLRNTARGWIPSALPDMPGVKELTNADMVDVRDIL